MISKLFLYKHVNKQLISAICFLKGELLHDSLSSLLAA